METISLSTNISKILILALPFNRLIFIKGTLRIQQKNESETIFIKITIPSISINNTYFSRNILQYGNQTLLLNKKVIKSVVKTDNYELIKECKVEEGKLEDIQFNSEYNFYLNKSILNINKEDISKFIEFTIDFQSNNLILKSNGIKIQLTIEAYGNEKKKFNLKITDFKYLLNLINIFEGCKVVGGEGVINFIFNDDEIHISCFVVSI